MTEDMREREYERFIKHEAGLPDNHDLVRSAFDWAWQAALSSAGTSGRADDTCLICGAKRGDSVRAHADFEIDMPHPFVRGDSPSGKGDATKIPTGSTEPTSDVDGAGKVQDAAPSPTAAPDRAEELAREIVKLADKHASDAGILDYDDFVSAVASLLRRERGRTRTITASRCHNCGNELFDGHYSILCHKPGCLGVAAPPREEG